MEEDIWTFKFRLIIWDDNFKKIYLDELPNFKPHYITNSRCEYNWFEYSNDRISRGFDKDGVFMQASLNNGFLVVSIITNDPLNKLVSVLKSDYTCDSPSIVTRPLIDWLKLFLNGQISDGVGENEVALYNGKEVWLDEIISNEPTESDKRYFEISDPISETNDRDKIQSLHNTEILNKLDELIKQYQEIWNKSGKLDKESCDKINDICSEIDHLREENEKYMISKLNNI